jgi:4-alpha-glucanotransferase
VIPAQDLLELGSDARMNTPAVSAGNWSWRAPEKSWTPERAARFAALIDVTDRDNDPLGVLKAEPQSGTQAIEPAGN